MEIGLEKLKFNINGIQFSRISTLTFGILVLILGLISLAEYIHFYRNQPFAILLNSIFANSDWFFILSGICLILSMTRRNDNILFWLGLFLISFATIMFFKAFYTDTVMNLFFNVYVIRFNQFQTSMLAPNAAILFVIAGIAFCLMNPEKNRLSHCIILGAIGLFIFVFSFYYFFSFVTGTHNTYSFGLFSSMHPQSSLSFMLLGSGILSYAFYTSYINRITIDDEWVMLIIIIAAFFIVGLLWHTLQANEMDAIQRNLIADLGLFLIYLIAKMLRLTQLAKQRAEKIEKHALELQKAQLSLSRAQKIAHMGSFVWDLNNDLITCSEEAFAIMGKQEFVHLSIRSADYYKHIHEEDRERMQSAIKELILKRIPISETHSLVREDKVLSIVRFDAAVSQTENNKPTELTGMIQDITDQKVLEKQFIQAQKMEVIGQLTGGLAHDYNNLLMVIRGNIELLEEDCRDDSPQKRRLKTALEATDRGIELAKRLVGFSRHQTLKPQKVMIKEMVDNITKLLKPTLGESIKISSSLTFDLWDIFVDPAQLQNALLNLAVNARDAMRYHGKLIFAAENISYETLVHLGKHEIQPGDYVKISVIDNGAGIPDNIMDRIFEPFFTTKPVGKGSGLGLSMVYAFVKQSGGGVTIYSTPNIGTTFNLYFPKLKEHEENHFLTDNKLENPVLLQDIQGDGKILVVEDDAAVREFTAQYLKNLGYHILEASNGVEALSILEEVHDIDLLLTDVIMPEGVSGPELAQKAVKQKPSLKVLFVSGYPKSVLSTNYDFTSPEILTKPYSMKNLGVKIKEILNK